MISWLIRHYARAPDVGNNGIRQPEEVFSRSERFIFSDIVLIIRRPVPRPSAIKGLSTDLLWVKGESQATDPVRKPFFKAKLIQAVKHLLQRHQKGRKCCIMRSIAKMLHLSTAIQTARGRLKVTILGSPNSWTGEVFRAFRNLQEEAKVTKGAYENYPFWMNWAAVFSYQFEWDSWYWISLWSNLCLHIRQIMPVLFISTVPTQICLD